MLTIQEYLDSLQNVSEISQYTISLGTGGWRTWERILSDVATTTDRCMRLRTPIERKICKYRIKVIEATRKIAFLRTINCKVAKQPEACDKQVDEQIAKLNRSLRDNTEKVTQAIRTRPR